MTYKSDIYDTSTVSDNPDIKMQYYLSDVAGLSPYPVNHWVDAQVITFRGNHHYGFTLDRGSAHVQTRALNTRTGETSPPSRTLHILIRAGGR